MEQPLFCQSCGKPLYSSDKFGTNKDGIPIEEYCKQCYISGEFTQQVTMDEMIALCAKSLKAPSRPTAVANMRVRFPALRRWEKQEERQHEYHKSVSQAIEYITQHIESPLTIASLIEEAGLSPLHFHRIFKATLGETLASYLKRKRLEWVALQLQTTLIPLSDLALRIGYSSEQTLSRAFKKHFALPPSVFREYYWNTLFETRICRMPEKVGIILSNEIDPFKLCLCADIFSLSHRKSEYIELVTPDHPIPSIPYITVKERIKTSPMLTFKTIPEGLYIIFVCRENPHEFYQTMVPQWLNSMKHKHAPHSAYIKLISEHENQQTTEIYVPIK